MAIDKPDYYDGTACAEISRYLPSALAQAFQYVWRASRKENEIKDLNKALWWLVDYENHPVLFPKWAETKTSNIDKYITNSWQRETLYAIHAASLFPNAGRGVQRPIQLINQRLDEITSTPELPEFRGAEASYNLAPG